MFVITTKVSKTKLAAAVTLLIAAVVLVAVLAAAKTAAPQEPDAMNGETNDARVAFLAQYDWQVNAEPVQTQSIKIPAEDSEVFRRYNELQKSQGYDLSALAGKNVTRYVYALHDCGAGEWYATVLEYRGEIVGGDVTNNAPGGTMHGFARPA